MQKRYPLFVTSIISLACMSSVFAAEPVNLNHQSASVLNSFSANGYALKETSSDVDFNQTKHIRLQQTFQGFLVWGGDAIAHVAKNPGATLKSVMANSKYSTTLNGTLYRNLEKDLGATLNYVTNPGQKDKALQQAIGTYQKKSGMTQKVSDIKNDLIVYVDQNNKAHWAYHIRFFSKTNQALPAKPNFIMDATTFAVYQQWNNIQTLDDVSGGGFGGNEKMGKLSYDGLAKDLPSLKIERDAASKMCSIENADVTVLDVRNNDAVVQFQCDKVDSQHNNEYWDADQDAVNGGYSPSNDALFAGKVIKEMYQNWYNLPVLTRDGKPMLLVMRVHEYMDNAYWDGQQMTFGDGISMFYPLVSLGVGAHEISHGFTEQHSGLQYYGQSGGLNEAFSDMAAQAAETYAYGHNSWQIGPEIFKAENQALRYMDKPSKDCQGRQPGDWCSIDNVSQYSSSLDVHFSSGIFNRIFYLMGTAKNWDTKKAFDVMVKANMNYWTATSSFTESACGVVKATKDYQYDMTAVTNAMKTVGIDISQC